MYSSLSLNPAKIPPLIRETQIQRNPNKNWTAIIKRHANLKNDRAILSTFTQMESLGLAPDAASLPLVFKACSRLQAFERGKRIHLGIEGTDLMEDVRIGTAVIDFYCKFGDIGEAEKLFDEMTVRDLVLWNAMLSGYVDCGCYREAVQLFRRMQREDLEPNSRTLVALVRACEGVLDLRLGQEIHGYCLRNGLFELCPHLGTALIGFYMNFDVSSSGLVFDSMASRSSVSWNAMITGYFEVGDFVKSIEFFIQMLEDGVEFDSVTLLVVIQAIAEFGSLKLGTQIHQLAIKVSYDGNLFVAAALLNMYVDIGNLYSARCLFDSVNTRDIALWNSMIAAYIDYDCHNEAISLFVSMRTETREEERTVSIMLSLCAELPDGLKAGRSLHALALKHWMEKNVPVGNSLLAMYANFGSIEEVQKVFNEIDDVDVLSCNILISAFSSHGLTEDSWKVFQMMRESDIKPNYQTLISLLSGCANEKSRNIGRLIHGFAIKHNIETSLELTTSLVDMYMNCGDDVAAQYLFDSCSGRDLVSWNAIIAAFIRNNRTNEALMYFNRLISETEPNSVSIITILSTCTGLGNLPLGQSLHAYATRRLSPLSQNPGLANAVLTMYTKCGNMGSAEKIFKTLKTRNIISWNSMITGYGSNGYPHDAILAFYNMLEDGLQPNGLTFLSVLSACRHGGLIDKGLQLFHSMAREFKVKPELSHYSCVVDLLSRGGCLNEAKEFIDSMPIKPDASVWRSLLSACRAHKNVELAREIFGNLVELEPMNAGNYILMSNTYASAGLWSEVRHIRNWLRENGLKKQPGASWIAVRDEVHSFTAGDTSHPESYTIYETLNSLLGIIRESGYVNQVCCIEED